MRRPQLRHHALLGTSDEPTVASSTATDGRVRNAPPDPDAPDQLYLVVYDARRTNRAVERYRWLTLGPEGRADFGKTDDPDVEVFIDAAVKVQVLMKRLGFGGDALQRLANGERANWVTALVRHDPANRNSYTSPAYYSDANGDGKTTDPQISLGNVNSKLDLNKTETHAHEIAHGLVERLFTPYGLKYTCSGKKQPGALNEHLADVVGMMVKHMQADPANEVPAAQYSVDDWNLVEGFPAEMKNRSGGKAAVRNFLEPGGAHEALPGYLNADDQMSNWRERTESIDPQHRNSGPLNYAFARAAQQLSGPYIDTLGRTWLHAASSLRDDEPTGEEWAHAVYTTAAAQFADRPALRRQVQSAVLHGFRAAGFSESMIKRGPASLRRDATPAS